MHGKPPCKLASGPLGPNSLFGTRRAQKVATASAIIDACVVVLADELRPSIKNVHGVGRGFSERTLNRAMYKPILKAAQRRHEASLAGEWQEGQTDELSAMQRMVAEGYWIARDRPDDVEEDGSEDPSEISLEQALALISEQRTVIARQAEEIQRRDEQLYHAVGVAGQRGQLVARLREVIRESRTEIETLTAAPWAPRERHEWGDDDG